ncbi:MAG: TonB-dependent receptor, partial [Ignavibacteriaceae bacterium]
MKNFLIIFLIIFCGEIFSQTFSIKGIVIDAETGNPIIGVNVIIENTNSVAATDNNGYYEIEDLNHGKYNLIFSSVGYGKKKVNNLEIKNRSVIINVSLNPSPFEYGTVVKSASKYQQQISDLPIKAEIIPAENFSSKNFTNLEDALRYVPGVNMTDDQISIRGSSGYSRGAGSRVMLTLDGIPFSTGDTGETIWEVIPTAVIGDVEIIKGAASSLYGSSAIGGVINVNSKDFSDNPQTYFKSDYGIYDKPSYKEWDWSKKLRSFNRLTIEHSQKINNLSFGISFTRLEDESYKQSGFSKKYIGFLKAKYDFTNLSSLSLIANTFNKRSGNFVYWKDSRNALVPSDADQGQRVATNRHLLGLIYKNIYSNNFFYEARASYYYTDWEDGTEINNNSTTNLFRGELQATIKTFQDAVIVSGVEASVANVKSNIFRNPTSNSFGVYSQVDYSFSESIKSSLGIRYDYTKLDTLKNFSAFSPRIGFNFKPDSNLIIRAFAGSGFRAPTLA